MGTGPCCANSIFHERLPVPPMSQNKKQVFGVNLRVFKPTTSYDIITKIIIPTVVVSFIPKLDAGVFSSSRTGVFSSCCLALDSSSSFPCPAFRAIAKSAGVFSSSRTGVFSSCCLALDSSSSFPCPAFRAIAKSKCKRNRCYEWLTCEV
ncbi:hypothetical protein STEG23_007926, partial [Scotinomys teguina]